MTAIYGWRDSQMFMKTSSRVFGVCFYEAANCWSCDWKESTRRWNNRQSTIPMHWKLTKPYRIFITCTIYHVPFFGSLFFFCKTLIPFYRLWPFFKAMSVQEKGFRSGVLKTWKFLGSQNRWARIRFRRKKKNLSNWIEFPPCDSWCNFMPISNNQRSLNMQTNLPTPTSYLSPI